MKHTEGTECSSNSCHQWNNIYANITTKHCCTCVLKQKPRDANVHCIEYNSIQCRTTASKCPQPSWRRPLTLCPMTPPWWLRTLAGRSCQAYTTELYVGTGSTRTSQICGKVDASGQPYCLGISVIDRSFYDVLNRLVFSKSFVKCRDTVPRSTARERTRRRTAVKDFHFIRTLLL